MNNKKTPTILITRKINGVSFVVMRETCLIVENQVKDKGLDSCALKQAVTAGFINTYRNN